ncbi:MAG: hypothetical protein ACE5GX_09275 [Thermoanaerobaculia bacterium]
MEIREDYRLLHQGACHIAEKHVRIVTDVVAVDDQSRGSDVGYGVGELDPTAMAMGLAEHLRWFGRDLARRG